MDNDALVETLSLTVTVDKWGHIVYTNRVGQLHRQCGPAVIWANGRQEWYQNDILHRDDGPAIIRDTGDRQWFLEGLEVTEEVFNERVKSIR